jgi:hypothetical protein
MFRTTYRRPSFFGPHMWNFFFTISPTSTQISFMSYSGCFARIVLSFHSAMLSISSGLVILASGEISRDLARTFFIRINTLPDAPLISVNPFPFFVSSDLVSCVRRRRARGGVKSHILSTKRSYSDRGDVVSNFQADVYNVGACLGEGVWIGGS